MSNPVCGIKPVWLWSVLKLIFTLTYGYVTFIWDMTLIPGTDICVFTGAASYWFGGKYNWICQAVDYSTDPEAINILSISWWFYLSKFIDFFDSIFFVLRKKYDHLSPLHVIHHSTLPFFSWFGPKYAGGGNTTFGGMWNSLVHLVMYSYYFLAACGPHVQKHLWWKKYLTTMQMIQFMVVILHGMVAIVHPTCGFSIGLNVILMFNGCLYWILFMRFYKKAYRKVEKKPLLDENCNTKLD